ncbi:MAG: hypothetical protein Q8R17_02875 [bacterium]|nr:hypothetical protein [bacterium]
MKMLNSEKLKEESAEIMVVAEKIANHINKFQAQTIERMEQIEGRVFTIEKEVDEIKKVVVQRFL